MKLDKFNFKKIFYFIFLLFLVLIILGCDNGNIFGWTHNKGSNKDTAALLADGDRALRDKDYKKAERYYREILERDPNNSLALYGLAQALAGQSGLDFNSIVTNILNTSTSHGEPLIPNLSDLQRMYGSSQAMIDALEQIASGHADGSIKSNDLDVNANLGVALVINAALGLLDTDRDGQMNGPNDLVNIDDKYNITLNKDINQLTDGEKTAILAQVEQAIVDIIGGNKAAAILGPGFSGDTSEKGALNYLETACNSDDLPNKDAINETRDLVENFFQNSNKQADEYDLKSLWFALKN